ncbi:MAG: hypothetical protein WB643_05335 [Candidatus Bathyarchaeia archaeon]
MFQFNGGKPINHNPKRHAPTMERVLVSKFMKYLGGLICTFGGVYLGNAYGAAYWRFGPFNLAWDTIFRGSILVVIGLLLIRFSK